MDNFKFSVLLILAIGGSFMTGVNVGQNMFSTRVKNYLRSDNFRKDMVKFVDALNDIIPDENNKKADNNEDTYFRS